MSGPFRTYTGWVSVDPSGQASTRSQSGRPAPPANKKDLDMQYRPQRLPALVVVAGALLSIPVAHADNDNNTLIPNNKRLNDGVVANVFTVQHQGGCNNDVRISPQLQAAAQR